MSVSRASALPTIPSLPSLLPSTPSFKMSIASARIVLRNLEDLDYANTRALMSERFSRSDLQAFIEMWYWRNYSASLCIEYMGAILGFALVVENKLEYLVVSTECEGRGFGRVLVKYVVEILKATDYRGVVLMTANDETLRSWYGRQGFEHSSSSCDGKGIFGDTMVFRFRTKRAAAAKHVHASRA